MLESLLGVCLGLRLLLLVVGLTLDPLYCAIAHCWVLPQIMHVCLWLNVGPLEAFRERDNCLLLTDSYSLLGVLGDIPCRQAWP